MPGKSVFVALLVVFLPGIVFAVFELFVFEVPVKGRSRLAAWVFLMVGAVCFLGLLVALAREGVRRGKGGGAGPG